MQQIVNPVLSNLIGGIGYFHGQSVIKTSDETGKESYFINDDYHELYSAVPSRPTFPRGFMWDEGVFSGLACHQFPIVWCLCA